MVTDYATARIRLTVPGGVRRRRERSAGAGVSDDDLPAEGPGAESQAVRVHVASQPLRYLAFIVSRFVRAETVTIGFPELPKDKTQRHADGGTVVPQPQSVGRSQPAADVARPRARGRAPPTSRRSTNRSSATVRTPASRSRSSRAICPAATVRRTSPSLNQPLPTTQLVWRNDPASFNNFPDFFLAHEVAHQWWGQAVGWQNYHEQWLSEGFAQYFAALYAQHQRGDEAFDGVMRQLRRWALEQSDQGPVSSAIASATSRRKPGLPRARLQQGRGGAAHAAAPGRRRGVFCRPAPLLPDESRFKKAGTDDFRARWRLRVGPLARALLRTMDLRIDPAAAGLQPPRRGTTRSCCTSSRSASSSTFRSRSRLNYADRKSTVIVAVGDRVVDKRVPLDGSAARRRHQQRRRDAG